MATFHIIVSSLLPDRVDIVIIGAGVTGLFIARELSRYDLKILVIDKKPDAGWGSTKGSAGIIHAFQLPFNSLKGKLCLEGNRMYDEISKELNVPFKRTGLIIVSLNVLENILAFIIYLYLKLNKINVHILTKKKLKKLEPNISKKAQLGLYLPSAGVISVFELILALVDNCRENGVIFSFNTEAQKIVFNDKNALVYTNKGVIETSWIINAAGINADIIAKMAGVNNFKIYPRKGTHLILSVKNIYNHLLAEVPLKPDPKTKGGGALLTIDGKILLGPNLIESTTDREDTSTELDDYHMINKYKRIIPSIEHSDVLVAYSGLRAASNTNDFIINIPRNSFVNVAGIQSPGLTAAPAIAKMVVQLLQRHIKLTPRSNFKPVRERSIKIRDLIDEPEKIKAIIKRNPDYGSIVCPCELVSKAEIVEAINKGITTLDGIKFYTNACMGECQGSYCLPVILDIFEELNIPVHNVTKKGGSSWIVISHEKRTDQ
ncbi:MAG: NAD(P)/FAD-dependent oxidoreductase [Thermoprotei archaeon]